LCGLKHIGIRENKTDRITRKQNSYGERIRMTIHIDLGHMKLNRKVKIFIIAMRNSEESVDLMKVS
jgi:hypothetical protein